jgi:ABC-type amino acid transport substrate-binding protein
MATAARRIILFVVILVAMGGLALFLWRTFRHREPTLQQAFPHGEIRIGVDASFPPFAVDNGESLFGVDIDLGRALGEKLGLPVRFETHGYDGLYDIVTTDRVDIVISALTVNPLRMGEVRYTRHYFDNGLMLVSPADSLLTSMETLPGHRLAYEFGGAAENQARQWLRRVADYELRPYELPTYALDAARLGEADATLVDNTTLHLYLRDHPDWHPQVNAVTNNFYAVAVRIDRLATWKFVDDAIWEFVADGTLDEILARWL